MRNFLLWLTFITFYVWKVLSDLRILICRISDAILSKEQSFRILNLVYLVLRFIILSIISIIVSSWSWSRKNFCSHSRFFKNFVFLRNPRYFPRDTVDGLALQVPFIVARYHSTRLRPTFCHSFRKSTGRAFCGER